MTAESANWIAALPERAFPVAGTLGASGALRVHLRKETYEAIWEHAGESLEREVCGVLIGEPARDASGGIVLIKGCIRGEFADNQEAQVTFTHRTWDYIHKEKERQFPAERIVGWYHTHPGVGIFLSGMDRFIHENFFNVPWQVALVVDPVTRDEGLFAWYQGRLERSVSCYAGEREIQPAKPARARVAAAAGGDEAAGGSTGLSGVELEKHLIGLRAGLDALCVEARATVARLTTYALGLGLLLLLLLGFIAMHQSQVDRQQLELQRALMKALGIAVPDATAAPPSGPAIGDPSGAGGSPPAGPPAPAHEEQR